MQISLPFTFIMYMFLQAVILVLAAMVYFLNRRSLANRYFAWFLLSISAWTMLGSVYMYFPVQVSLWVSLQMTAGIFLGPTFYFFARSLTDTEYKPQKIEYLLLLPALYIIVISLGRIFVPAFSEQFAAKVSVIDNKLHRVADLHYVVYTLGIFGEVIAGLMYMGLHIRHQTDPAEKRRLITVFFATLGLAVSLFIFNSLANLLGHSLDPNITMAALLITLTVISISIMRHKAWKIETLMDIIQKHQAELALRNQAIESELDLARLVQKKLLPEHPPAIAGLKISSYYFPMDKVGGDFYDYYTRDGRLGLIVADVSGHGIPGAFLATVAKMGFQSLAREFDNGPALMSRLDELITQRAVKSMFVTAVYARIDTRTMEMRLTNCGHCSPLVYGPSRTEVLEAPSASRPLGLSFGMSPSEQLIPLLKGDRILLYTDGILETMDAVDQEYGTDRLCSFLIGNHRQSSDDFAQGLMESLRDFSGTDEKIDDISLTIVDVL